MCGAPDQATISREGIPSGETVIQGLVYSGDVPAAGSYVRLLEAGHRVDVVARDLPLETTSAVAAAIWYPYRALPQEKVTAWAETSYVVFDALADTDPESGVRMLVGTEVFVRGLDKEDEYQADVHGMVIAARGGYNPYAMVSVLHTLDGAPSSDAGVALMFSTHPATVSRIERLEQVVGDKLEPYAGAEPPARMVRPAAAY